MTKPFAPVFAPYQERPGTAFATHAARVALAGTALALAACSSTPLPPWPSTGSRPQPPAVAPAAAPAPAASTNTDSPRPAAASVTPVAPSNTLEALPYSAAIAELFPDPAERYSTPGLSDGRRSLTTNSELTELLRELSQASTSGGPRLGVLNTLLQTHSLRSPIATHPPAGTISPSKGSMILKGLSS